MSNLKAISPLPWQPEKIQNGSKKMNESQDQVRLNNTLQSATLQANRQTVIESGSLVVSGDGKEFYYVYDASGKKELGFKYTGTTIELFPGTYQVRLNNTLQVLRCKLTDKLL
ncbi:MAG: hypothetical protein MZV65_15655 [Chromatiales bacterium]|nr:hypothetical protein [Chromatiales bacterium]